MKKTTFITGVFAAIAAMSSTAMANDYIIGDQGDAWNLTGDSAIDIEITSTSSNWKKFSNFVIAEDLWVYSSSSDNKIWGYTQDLGSFYMADLSSAPGTEFTVDETVCASEKLSIDESATSPVIKTGAGFFLRENTATLRCSYEPNGEGGHGSTITFAKDFGPITATSWFSGFMFDFKSSNVESATFGGTTYNSSNPHCVDYQTYSFDPEAAEGEKCYQIISSPCDAADGWEISYDLPEGIDACGTPPSNTTTVNESGSIAKNAWNHYGPFSAEDADFSAVMTGSGDADLYVKKGAQPTSSNYDCRPYKNGSNETCTLSGAGEYYVSVNGYADSSTYDLTITYEAGEAPQCVDTTLYTVAPEGECYEIVGSTCDVPSGYASYPNAPEGMSECGVCTQQVVTAIDWTNNCWEEFPTNCDVPSGWQITDDIPAYVNECGTTAGGNLALNATATAQESYYDGSESRLNDGDDSSTWYSNTYYNGKTVWVQLEWDQAQNMDFMEIKWASAYYPQEFNVWARINGTWEDYGTEVSNGTDSVVNLDLEADALYIVLKRSNGTYFGINEIIVE
jgi:hypothetical protein